MMRGDGGREHREISKFDALAERWWDPQGPLRTLHQINPLRLDYLDNRCPLRGCRILDIGCGAGLLSEGLASRGATVTGIDLAPTSIDIAREHAARGGLEIDYRAISAPVLAAAEAGSFDAVVCFEVLEHVEDVDELVRACGSLVKPGGHVFFSTLNRTARSFMLAIVAAEYLLDLLPRGTHEYAAMVRPSELATACRHAGLEPVEFLGMHANPLTGHYWFADGIKVNYFCHARADAD